MLITMAGMMALERLRTELQEHAGDDFPHAMLPQLLMLYDVCCYLELGIFQTREVLGEAGWAFVRAELSAPVGKPTARAFEMVAQMEDQALVLNA